MWLKLALTFLSLANSAIAMFREREQRQAGANEEKVDALVKTQDAITVARNAARAVHDDPAYRKRMQERSTRK